MTTKNEMGTGAPFTGPLPAGAPSAGAGIQEEERERLLNLFDKFSLAMYFRLREATIKEIDSTQNASTEWYLFEWHDLFNFVYFINETIKLMQTNEDFRRIFVYIRNVWVNRVYEVVVAIPKEMIS